MKTFWSYSIGTPLTGRLCLTYAPARILEYADPVREANGTSTAAAAILYKADPLPAWAFDLRFAGGHPTQPLPYEVRFVSFRNDGDGWRALPFDSDIFLRGRTHVVREDGG